jgi:LemA protein
MNSDEILQAYINKMLTLQGQKRDMPFSPAELKQIALDMGMSEEDWLLSQQTFDGYLKSGLGHLRNRNYRDAIKELEQAVALNPNHAEAAHGLAGAFLGKYKETHSEADRREAEKYAELALQIRPGHQPTLNILAELRQGEKFVSQTKRSKTLIFYGAIAGVVALLFVFYFYTKNAVVARHNEVKSKWAQVENVYQRRADLIPSLMKTVKARAEFEQRTLTNITKALDKTASVKGGELSSTELNEYAQAQTELKKALDRLLDEAQKSDELQASQAFRDLQLQIEGSDNRISVERKKFNEAVADHNTFVQTFPYSLLGYGEIDYFKMEKGADKSPL